MSKKYYTRNGDYIRNPEAYAKTGAPMYETKYDETPNINQETDIYKLELEGGKKYIGKTTNIDRRMNQHFSGNGSRVTKKFKPIEGEIIDTCHGYFSDKLEQKYTDKNIKKHGYDKVRGGKYVNSKTFTDKKKVITCFKCGKKGHYANTCRVKFF
tara:strand:+ start:151 stop:615 length:465 start_codon:yes stop_codon:yes gene_type:complete